MSLGAKTQSMRPVVDPVALQSPAPPDVQAAREPESVSIALKVEPPNPAGLLLLQTVSAPEAPPIFPFETDAKKTTLPEQSVA